MTTGAKYNEDVAKFMNKKVNLNGKDISDIIFIKRIFDYGFYYNASAHKASRYLAKVIRKDKRFIIIDDARKDKISVRGRYMYIDEETGFLCTFIAALKRTPFGYKWKETERGLVCKEEEMYHNHNAFYRWSSNVDICGQAIVVDRMLKKFQLSTFFNKSGYYYTHNNMAVSIQKTMLDYFGGTSISCGDLYNYSVLEDVEQKLSEFVGPMALSESIKCIGCDNKPMPVDEKAAKIMLDTAERIFLRSEVINMKPSGMNLFTQTLSYLEKDGDEYIERIFVIVCDYKYPLRDTKLSLVEIKRIRLDIKTISNSSALYNGAPSLYNGAFSAVPVYRAGGAKGTTIEHVVPIIDDAIDFVNNGMDDLEYDTYCEYLMQESKNTFGVEVKNAIFVAMLIVKHPILEKLANVRCNGSDEFRKRLLHYLNNQFDNFSDKQLENLLKKWIGLCYIKEEKLHKAIGLPKGMLEEIICRIAPALSKISGIHLPLVINVKQAFSNEKGMLFLQNMNRNDWKEVLNFFLHDKAADISLENEITFEHRAKYLNILCRFYGYNNLRLYIKHFIEIMNKDDHVTEFFNYMKYLEFIDTYTVHAEGYEWKISGEKLEREVVLIDDITDDSKASILGKVCNERIKYRAASLSKYRYEKYGYRIVIPKESREFFREASSLNNCLRTFVDAHARGETTILFIRKTDNNNKPFFDLEIKDGQIHQCHGINNCNVADCGKNLDLFLKEFCERNKIEYTDGAAVVGARERQ